MSFGEKYLELRRQSGENTQTTANSSTQASASESSAGGSTYGRTYLALRNQYNSKSVSERAAEKTAAIQKYAQKATETPTSYYSRPELGGESETLYGNVTSLQQRLEEMETPLTSAKSSLDELQTALTTAKANLSQAKAAYEADPTEATATSYNQLTTAYNEANSNYQQAYSNYTTAYDEYKNYENQLVDAMVAYNLYAQNQQTEYETWKGTIRDSDTVQQEMDALDEQINALKAEENQDKTKGVLNAAATAGLYAMAGGQSPVTYNPETDRTVDHSQLLAELEKQRALLQEEYDYSKYYQYADLMDNDDFAEKSQYSTTANEEGRNALDVLTGLYTTEKSGYDDPLYEYINGNSEAGRYLTEMELNQYENNPIAQYFATNEEGSYQSQQMTEDEVAIFNYLYATQGQEAAYDYYNYLQSDLNYRQRETEGAELTAFAQEHPIAASVMSVAMSPMKGVSYLGQAADYLQDGSIDQNAGYNRLVYTPSSWRTAVSEKMEESGAWGKVGSFLYQTGLSMADFLLNTVITGGNEALTLAIMGTGAAADTVVECKDRGLSDDQSFWLGTIAGAAEIITEKVSLETLLNPDLLKNGAGQYILKNMLAEGSEEVGSDIINLVADILISGDESEIQKTIDEYIADGKTEGEAFGLAVAEQAAEMGLDFLGGALSGGVMSTVNAGIHVNFTNNQADELAKLNLDKADIQDFIDTGLESGEDTASYQMAKKLQAKMEAGEEITNYELAELYQANEQALAEEQAEGKNAEETAENSQETAENSQESENSQASEQDTETSVEAEQGLSLPTLDDMDEVERFLSEQEASSEQGNNSIHVNANSGLTAAQQLRQAENLNVNGGNQNVQTNQQFGGITTAAGGTAAGNSLPSGSQQRNAGKSAGKQAEQLAGSTGVQQKASRAYSGRTAVERQNRGGNLRLPKVSSQELGITTGTETRNVQVYPQEAWDQELQQVAQRIYNETGKEVTFVLGRMQVRGDGGAISNVRGAYTGDKIIVQADNFQVTAEQIADHEAYHAKVDQFGSRLNNELVNYITEKFSIEEFYAVVDKYLVGLRGIIDRTAEYEAQMMQAIEEVLADAYAGINAFGAGATKFTEAANERMNQLWVGKQTQAQENGVRQTNGPNEESRYSYAGENANNADLEALERAKEMEKAGVANETIRQQTGWFQGMDGKWRWEIDDSGMEYYYEGDAQYDRSRPEYTRLDELKQKMFSEGLSVGEEQELRQLSELWGDERNRMNEQVTSGNATLADLIHHDTLFEAYPQLRKAKVVFENLGTNTNGFYDAEENTIVLSEELRYTPESTLIHEIQHAVQEAENFASGSSPAYWQQQIDDGYEAQRTARDLYRDTAGEIEARDVASRRNMTAEQRRQTPPNLGDENTVFAEKGGENQQSIGWAADKKPFVIVDADILDGVPRADWAKTARENLKEKFPNGVTLGNNDIQIDGQSRRELTHSRYMQWLYNNNPELHKDKLRATNNADEILQATTDWINEGLNHPRKDNIKDFARGKVLLRVGTNDYAADVVVGTRNNGNMVLYDILKLQPSQIMQKETGAALSTNPSPGAARKTAQVSGNTVAQKDSSVKRKFSLDEPVEETGTLIALHNLNSEKMNQTLDLGAWPSPSIAIVQAEQGHTKYGDYSVLFPRSTIDPEADARNKVYGSDAWTPTSSAAQVEREVNYKAMRKLERKLNELSKQVAGGMFTSTSTIQRMGVEDVSTDNAETLARRMAEKDEVRAAYLADMGESLEPIKKAKRFSRYWENDVLQKFVDDVGIDEIRKAVTEMQETGRIEQAMEPIKDSITQATRNAYEEEHRNFLDRREEKRPGSKRKNIDNYIANKVTPFYLEEFAKNALEYYEDGGRTKGENDPLATSNALREKTNTKDVQAWLQPQIEAILGEPAIYNGAERFTRSGNRRSFASTHWAYTAENIVRAMNNANSRGEGMWGADAGSIVATATPEYGSIDEMHADEARLQTVEQEAYNEIVQDIQEKLNAVTKDIMKTTEHHSDNSYEEGQTIGGIITEAAQNKRTTAGIKQTFRKEGYNISDLQAKHVSDLLNDAAKVPTGYFEAKPQRVVGFDEAVVVLAPDNAPMEQLMRMQTAGMNVETYEAGNDAQRLEKLNKYNARFSAGEESQVAAQQSENLTEGQQQNESLTADQQQNQTAADQPQEKKPAKKKAKKPVAVSKPLIAKQDLKRTLYNLFSVPAGQKAELGQAIEYYAGRMIKSGELTEADRQAFFDRMYESGVMTIPADEYYKMGREELVNGKIYLTDSQVAELGDNWNDLRRRAFAAGVYLTRNRSDTGLDVWNADLAADLPGLFDAGETDSVAILDRIIQVAEEGRDEKASLAEYTSWLAGEEGISEEEFLDNMERQMDWALRTFAEKANLEVKLRDRTGVKIAQEREAHRESLQRQRERKQLQELQQKTLKQLQWLNKNRYRAPEELKAAWDEVLGDIDVYAVGAANEMRWSDKYNATWKDLAQMYKDAQKYDPNFFESEDMKRIVQRLDAEKIGDMDIDALNDLYKAAVGIRTEFYNRNNVINDENHRLFSEVYDDVKKEIKDAPGGFKGNIADKFMNMQQLTPMNNLERMAGWNPDSTFYSMAKQLERGERDVRAYTVKAQRMLQEFLEENEEWVRNADGQGKNAIWYEVEVPKLLELGMGNKPIFGETVKVYMTPAQKVHMYLESKNLDNLRHMSGGRTFVDKELYSKGQRQEAFTQGTTIRLAPETVKSLVSDLTAEEMELANVLEKYYNSFAKNEINKVSNILVGFDKAMGSYYAPIYTDSNYTTSEFGKFDVTAEGVGHMKARQYSAAPSYNISAFDAFERHVDQTSRYVGMAIPTRNWNTLMNWNTMVDNGKDSTRANIGAKWGQEGEDYIDAVITELQGGTSVKGDVVSDTAEQIKSNYISAIFGANPSIVLKQLGSIPLASVYLDAKNFPSLSQIHNIDTELIAKYTQDLAWRTMGYSMPETKQLKDTKKWQDSNKVVEFTLGGGAITWMDGWAASTLWPWAENKVRRESPDLEIGTQAQIDNGESPFYKKVAEEFENAVARSQSTSDIIHQGTLRKSKNPVTQIVTMFRSDSAQTYNAIRQKIGEARYYQRTGADAKTIRAAKKAAGSAFVTAMVGYTWAEVVEFLMNLWKHGGKAYRDDDDELTAQSVLSKIGEGIVGDMAGIVVYGEELYELVGNILSGESWYGLETMATEQLVEIGTAIWDVSTNSGELISNAFNIVNNGGDLGEYLSDNSGTILGTLKEAATTLATYIPGFPVENMEAYLVGIVRNVSPELGEAYDALFEETGKSSLSGLEGDALQWRINDLMSGYGIDLSEDAEQTLAELYEQGYKNAIPSDTPSSITVNGESQELNAYKQQTYNTIRNGIISGALEELMGSDTFANADGETQAKMLANLYTYAAEQAKAGTVDDYEIASGTQENMDIVASGVSVAQMIEWNTASSGMDAGEKAALLESMDISSEAKQAIFQAKISSSEETAEDIQTFLNAGLTFDDYLTAFSKAKEIRESDIDSDMKAIEYAQWAQRQGYSGSQLETVKSLLSSTKSEDYEELVAAGMSEDEAYGLIEKIVNLEPEDGATSVSTLQKWRTCVEFSDDVDDQLTALSMVMTDAQLLKAEIANDLGVNPEIYVTFQEIKSEYDADGNGSYKNSEIQAAIDGMPGYYTNEQKAVLWQLATGSTSAKNNPYSQEVGQQVLDAKAAANG